MQKWRLRNRLRVETLALAGAALAAGAQLALAAAQPRAPALCTASRMRGRCV